MGRCLDLVWFAYIVLAPHILNSFNPIALTSTPPTNSCWNGDRRLRDKYGDEVFEAFEEQTSVLPFKAILEVSQEFVSSSLSSCVYIYVYICIYMHMCVSLRLDHPHQPISTQTQTNQPTNQTDLGHDER